MRPVLQRFHLEEVSRVRVSESTDARWKDFVSENVSKVHVFIDNDIIISWTAGKRDYDSK